MFRAVLVATMTIALVQLGACSKKDDDASKKSTAKKPAENKDSDKAKGKTDSPKPDEKKPDTKTAPNKEAAKDKPAADDKTSDTKTAVATDKAKAPAGDWAVVDCKKLTPHMANLMVQMQPPARRAAVEKQIKTRMPMMVKACEAEKGKKKLTKAQYKCLLAAKNIGAAQACSQIK